jgi:NitT/TauT family transport system substrate-binding protein
LSIAQFRLDEVIPRRYGFRARFNEEEGMTRGFARTAAAVLVVAFAVLFAACGDSDSDEGGEANGGAADSKTTTVKVAYVPYVGAAPFKLGIDKGFFSKRGLEIEDSEGVAPAPIMAQVVAGKLDVGFTTIPALIAAASNGAPLQAISSVDGVIDPEKPVSAIMVTDDSPIRSPKDLEGKKVGVVALQSELDVLLHEAVRRDGGDQTKVQSVQVPFPEMTTALKAGRVDAVVNTEPFVTLAKEEGVKAINYPEAEIVPNGTVTAFVASKSFIAENPDVVERFQDAMVESLEYADAHPDETQAAMTQIAEIEPALLKKINVGTIFETEIDVPTIEKFIALQEGFGFVKDAPTAADLLAEGAG